MNDMIKFLPDVKDISFVNKSAALAVAATLPEIVSKIRIFDRNNSQTTLSLMSLTMLNGQSPMRVLRQIMAEVDTRRMALAEAQLAHTELVEEINQLENKEKTKIEESKLRLKKISLENLEGKINGSIKDIATLIDAYNNVKTKHNIDDWDEKTFENHEKLHHVRRGFELLYRNVIQYGRPHESTIEYLQQYGVHIQVALLEVSAYVMSVEEKIKNNQFIDASDMEDFFDKVAEKYVSCADVASNRLFGKENFANTDYMLTKDSKK